MNRNRLHPIREWLAAERAGREAEAERALAAAFRHLAAPEVSPHFATAVLARIDSSARPRLAIGWRLAIAALWLVVSLSVIYVPWVVVTLRGLLGLGNLVDLIGEAIIQVSRALVSWLSLWQTIGEINQILLNLLSRPVVAAVVVVTVGLATVALRLISGLLSTDGSRSHV